MTFLCIFLFIATCAISLIMYKKSKKNEYPLKSILALCAALIVCVGLEASLFNINFYTSFKNEPIDLSTYISQYKDLDGKYTVPSNTLIEFPEINTELNNIKIKLCKDSEDIIKVNLKLTDEANKFYFNTPQRTIYKNVESSEYINVFTAGNTNYLALTFEKTEKDFIKIESVTANEKRAFDFSLIRVSLLFAVLVLFYIFKPSSPIYKKSLFENKGDATSYLIAFLSLQFAVFLIVGTLNPTFLGFKKTEKGLEFAPLSYVHHNQYDELAQAVIQGKVYIDNDDVPQSLKDMENPYDTTARNQQSALSGDKYRWDVAYYDGHYYVYFGIVPLLLMYLPFRLIMNAPFPTALGIIAFAFIFAVGVYKLLKLICQKHFKNISIGVFLLTALSFVNGCGAMFLVKRPDFYSIPNITSMAFVVWGLYFWFKGLYKEKHSGISFFLGSLFMALSVGCRPQCALMCTLALPLFAGYFFKEKKLFTPEGVKRLAALGIPVIVVAAGIMYYNNLRFGSPVDFGSSYNLTTNDVTRRGFEIGRTGLGLFTYLFQPPSFTATFPYLKNAELETAYIGKTIYENCFGGLFAVTPVLWFTLFIKNSAKDLKAKKLFGFTVFLIIIGFATVIADTQAGGLLQRYFSDFGYIFFLACAIIIFSLFNKPEDSETQKILRGLLFISTILNIVYTICLVFSVSDVTIDTQRPHLFGEIKHLVEFWL